LQLDIVKSALSTIQTICTICKNRHDDDDGSSNNNVPISRQKMLSIVQSSLHAIVNISDDKDNTVKTKLEVDDFHRLKVLQIIVKNLTDENLGIGQEWGGDARDLGWTFISLAITCVENQWLEIEDFDLLSPVFRDMLRTLSLDAYNDFGKELFKILDIMIQTVPKSLMQESKIGGGLTDLLSSQFTPPKAKTQAKQMMKKIFG
jgi:hypothetical protein